MRVIPDAFDEQTFGRRVGKLYREGDICSTCTSRQQAACWKGLKLPPFAVQEKRLDVWQGANALAVLVGDFTEYLSSRKSTSLHSWLFGYELAGK